MNIEDIQLMQNIVSQVNDTSNGNKLLFLVSYTQIAKTNLVLLKALLEELNKNGIFITVDRPHQYMEHLLRMHRIDYKELLFIDTIARFSGSKLSEKDDGGNVKVMDSPFQIDLLPELFSIGPKNANGDEGKIDISGVNFIIIDNVATILSYNDFEMVESFLKNYLAKFQGMNTIFIPILLDRNTHGYLYQVARRLCDREIDIDKLRIGKSIKFEGGRERSLLSNEKNVFDQHSYRKSFLGGD